MKQVVILTLLFLIMLFLPALPGTLPVENQLYTSTIIGFILLASFSLGKVTEKINLPHITGYMVAGMLFGPYGLELFDTAHVEKLHFINDIALALIALSAGAELEWNLIKEKIANIINISIYQMVFIFSGISITFYYIFKLQLFGMALDPDVIYYAAIILGVIATANSPSSAIAIINETGSKGPVSNMVLGVSVIKDILVITLFAFVASYVQSTSADSTTISASEIFGSIFFEVLFSIATGIVVGLFVILYLKTLKKEMVVFTLGLAVICSSIGSMLHLNVLLICIVVGFLVRNFLEEGGGFVEWLGKSSMPLFVIFFTLTGASVNIHALEEMWKMAIVYFLLRLFLVWSTTTAIAKITDEKPEVTKHLWSGFIPQAGVSLGLAVIIGAQFPGWGSTLVTLIIAGIGINQIVGPVLFRFSLLSCGEGRKND